MIYLKQNLVIWNRMCWGSPRWKTALQAMESWWTTGWIWVSNVPVLLRRLMVFLAVLGKGSQADRAGWSFFSTHHQWGHVWSAMPVQKRSGHTGKSDWRTGLCLLCEEAERSEAVQPKKRDLWGNLTNECEGVYEYLQGECKDGARIFSLVSSARTRSSEHKFRDSLWTARICVGMICGIWSTGTS